MDEGRRAVARRPGRVSGWAAVGRPTEERGVSRVLAASVYEWGGEGGGGAKLRDALVRNVG